MRTLTFHLTAQLTEPVEGDWVEINGLSRPGYRSLTKSFRLPEIPVENRKQADEFWERVSLGLKVIFESLFLEDPKARVTILEFQEDNKKPLNHEGLKGHCDPPWTGD